MLKEIFFSKIKHKALCKTNLFPYNAAFPHESGNISTEEVLDSLTDKSDDEIELDLFQEENIDNIWDKKVHKKVEEFDSIQKKTIEIARKIKEKI